MRTGEFDERGLSQSVQAALLFPLVMMPFLLAFQWGLQTWAHSTALAAAQDGARTAAALGGSASGGEAVARNALDNGALTTATVHIDRGRSQTRATVSGKALGIIPFWDAAVRVTANAPTQQITNS